MTSFFAEPYPPHLQEAAKYREDKPPGTPWSIACEGPEREGRTKIYRHWRCRDGVLQSLDASIKSSHDMFEQSALRNGSKNCLGWRPYDPVTKKWGKYQWLSFETVRRRRAAFGVGLVELHNQVGDMRPKHGVGLWCQNRPEWQITDLACVSQSLYSVSIYDTLGPDAAEFIIKDAALTCVVASLPHIPGLLKIKPKCPSLKIIISIDPLDAGEQSGHSKKDILSSIAKDLDLKIYTMDEVEAIGAALNRGYTPPGPDDLVTINYTSGTTGNPKGVMLTHRAAVASTSNALVGSPHGQSETTCSYLPLAHIFARMAEHAALWAGVEIGYFHGDIFELVDDFKTLKPTMMISVPRLFNRMGGKIKSLTVDDPGFKGSLSRHIIDTKIANIKRADKPTIHHFLYDRLWGRKIRQQMGLDRFNTFISGAAPLDPTMHNFLRAAWGANLLQGYGLTEAYATTTVQTRDDLSTGNVGPLLPANEACLADIPDMGYHVTDKPYPRGELLLRGPAITIGYFNNPEETTKAFTEDGWFKTGDVAMIDDMGRFYIVDRKKNVLKLAQGEYIAPENLEGIYLSGCSYLQTGFIHGDSDQTFPVGLFGIQPDLFAGFASDLLGHKISETDMPALEKAMRNPKVVATVLKDMQRAAKTARLNGFERVRAIKLYNDPFNFDNDLMTPTLKLKRPKAVKFYRADLDALYAEALEKEAKTGSKVKSKL